MPKGSRIQKPTIRKILIEARRSERAPKSRMDMYSRVIWKRSARVRSQLRYGWKFLETFDDHTLVDRGHHAVSIRAEMKAGFFESPIAVKLTNGLSDIGEIKLGFKEKEVVVEAVQGLSRNLEFIDETSRELGEPWPNALLKVIESHAKKTGYSTVRIRKAETLYYYRLPLTGKKDKEKAVRGIRWDMRNFYSKVAKGAGYTEEARYYVKHLK